VRPAGGRPPLPPLQPGALVDVSEPGVLAPVVDKTPPLQYPQLALRQRLEGTVELNVLVDEKGLVTDATVVKGAGKAGLDEAAIENVNSIPRYLGRLLAKNPLLAFRLPYYYVEMIALELAKGSVALVGPKPRCRSSQASPRAWANAHWFFGSAATIRLHEKKELPWLSL
jgi:TonB family protein